MDISSCWLVVVILHYCLIGHPQTGPNARFHINLMPKFPPVFVCDKNQSLTLPPSQMICECAHMDLSWILSQAFGMFDKKTSGPLCFPRATTEGFCAHCKGKLLLLRTWNKMPGYQLLKGNIVIDWEERKIMGKWEWKQHNTSQSLKHYSLPLSLKQVKEKVFVIESTFH